MASNKQTIAFFGATGGSGATTLAHALKEGHHCTALARTPANLRRILTTEHNIPTSTIEDYLTIYQGNAKSALDVLKALVSPVDAKSLVDTIYSSIGAYPKFQWSLFQPLVLTDPTICEGGMAAIFAAIDQLNDQGIKTTHDAQKPIVIAVSSTAGPDRRQRTLPRLLEPLYYWLLSSPHTDKQKMEKLILTDGGAHVRSFVIVRPAILTNGAELGLGKVRIGWVWGVHGIEGREKEPGPAIGWTISRRDVGAWVFRKAVVEGEYQGRCVSMCY